MIRRRRARHWQTKFGRFVERSTVKGLVEGLRQELGYPIGRAAVYNWVLGYTTPRAEAARALERISGRRIRLGDIIEHRRVLKSNGAGNAPQGSAGEAGQQQHG